MRRLGLALLLALCAGCGATDTASSSGSGDPDLAGLAVVCSDFQSTAIALLDGEGRAVTAPLLIHSGSASPRVQVALSGDVDLPTVGESPLALIDREPVGVMTRVDPATGAVLEQLDLDGAASLNPHDALRLPGGRWLVTRYQPNLAPSDPDRLDLGDDVALLDPTGAPLAARSLGDADGFPGRPDRLLALGGTAWISLNRLAADYTDARPGALARLPLPAGDTLAEPERVALPDTRSCGPLATDGTRLAVSCAGRFAGDGYDPATSALVLLDGAGAEIARLPAADPRVGGTFGPGLAFDAGGDVVALVFGRFPDVPDRVVRWSPDDDTVTTPFIASGPFTAYGLASTTDGVPVVTDADPVSPRVCRLDQAGPACLDACAATGLPPVQVRRLQPATDGVPRHP